MSCYLLTISILLIRTHPAASDNGTTVDDKHYDDWNDLAVAYYNWGTDEPNTTPVFIDDKEALKNEKFKFMYNGGSLSWKGKTAKQIEEIDDYKKALTWALGIKGIDVYGRIYPHADCMGTLIHPNIIMTLCACVNSFYSSYYNRKPEETGSSQFSTSPTSDEQFDIRTPNLVASRTSWAGFQQLSGDTEKFPISKTILESPHCHNAVFAVDHIHIIQQYKSVAFLNLDVTINHPYSPVLLAYYNFTEDRLQESSASYTEGVEGIVTHFRYRKENVQVIAYFQEAYSQQKNKPNVVQLVKIKATGETMDFGSQLMGTEWKEIFKTRPGSRQKDAHKWLYTCERAMFKRFSDALEVYPGTDAGRHVWFDEFETVTRKPDVACFSLQAGLLCNAPPGSPVVLNDTLIGMTMTRVTNCTKILQKEEVNTFVLMLAAENEGLSVPEQIAALAANLYQKDLQETYALSQDSQELIDDKAKGDTDLVGNIDSQLVAPMAKFMKNNKFLIAPPARRKSNGVRHEPYFVILLLTMLLDSDFQKSLFVIVFQY